MNIRQKIISIIEDNLAVENVTDEKRLGMDLGADSLDRIEILVDITEAFDLDIADNDELHYADGTPTVGDIIARVEALIEQNPSIDPYLQTR